MQTSFIVWLLQHGHHEHILFNILNHIIFCQSVNVNVTGQLELTGIHTTITGGRGAWNNIIVLITNLFSLILSQITMWDLQSGKLLRTIADAHPLGSAVLHVMVRRGGDGKHDLIMQPSPEF